VQILRDTVGTIADMTVSDEIVARVLKSLPAHSSMESLREADDLKDVSHAELSEALNILVQRGQIRAGELFGRDA